MAEPRRDRHVYSEDRRLPGKIGIAVGIIAGAFGALFH